MGRITTDTIEKYLDGELSSPEAGRVASVLEREPEAKQELNQFSALGELIRMSNQERCKGVSFDGLSDRILSEISSSQQSLPIFERIQTWAKEFVKYRRAIWIPTVAATAAAIALLILPLSQAPVSAPTGANQGIALHTSLNTSQRFESKIASVDFGAAEGKTYNLPQSTGGTVGVVWIEENL